MALQKALGGKLWLARQGVRRYKRLHYSWDFVFFRLDTRDHPSPTIARKSTGRNGWGWGSGLSVIFHDPKHRAKALN